MRTIILIATFTVVTCYALIRPLSGVAVTPIAVTITTPIARDIYQRNGSNQASVTVTGTYSGGTPDNIQARTVMFGGFTGTTTDWTVIQTLPSGGTFSGSFTIAAGGWYQLQVRAVKSGQIAGTATPVSKIGVGEIFIVAGQSNAASFGGTTHQLATDDRNEQHGLSGDWALDNDPQPSASVGNGGASPWVHFADELAVYLNMPVGIVDVAVTDTSTADWVGTYYNSNLKPAIALFPANGFRAILWHQGETDQINAVSQATYQTNLRSLITSSRSDAGWTVPWGIANTASYDPPNTGSNQAHIQAAQVAVAGDANNFIGANTDDLTSGTYRLVDGVHMNDLGITTHGDRWYTKVKTAFSW